MYVVIPTIQLKNLRDFLVSEDQATIIFLFENFTTSDIPATYQKYSSALTAQKFSGALDSLAHFHDGIEQVSFIGCGSTKHFSLTQLFDSLGNTIRNHIKKFTHLAVHAYQLEKVLPKEKIASEITYIADLSSYQFSKYKSEKKSEVKEKIITVILSECSETVVSAFQESLIIAEGVKFTRDICNEPPNVATPMYLAYHMKADSTETPYTVEIFDDKKIQEMGMNLVYAVGKGSTKPSFFAKISYFGDPSTKEFRALVGKGVAFDAGGVQVKPDFSMCTMKTDMSGAAAVMGTIHTIAKLQLKTNVIGYVPFVQNMPDGNAYCPDDVYTAFNGKTVEIVHTDAEGRLVLADALAYASMEKPLEIIDLATLTGAAIIALGHEFAAIMGTGEQLKNDLIEIGNEIHEALWPMPFHKNYMKYLKSHIADMTNLGQTRMAPGTIIGGMFLKEFVGEDLPWVHLDIAATSHVTEDSGIKSGNSTGFGVRLLVEYLKRKQG